MGFVLMDDDGRVITLHEKPKAWVGGYDYRITYSFDLNKATVFDEDHFLGRYQKDYRTKVGDLLRCHKKLSASVKIERTVTLEEER